MEGLKIILIASAFFNFAEGACKAHDASWNRGTKPRISQPQRREPDKVLIDWSRSIRNARCVDSYNIYVWKVGQLKERGQKIYIADKTAKQHNLVIDPCVDYNFSVEFIEKDWTHTDQEESAIASFKTEAVPQLINSHRSNFKITYATRKDPSGKVIATSVDRANIAFNKNLIKHASCIKHIEVTGTIDNSPIGPAGGSSQSGQRAFGFNQGVGGSSQTGGYGQVGGNSQTGGRGQVGGNSQTGGQWQVGGNSQTGGRGQVGGNSQTGGHGQVGGNSQTGGFGQVGGNSQTSSWTNNQHLLPDNYAYVSSYPNCPIGGSMQSNQYGRYDPNCYWSTRPNNQESVQPTARPPYNTNDNNGGGLNWNNQRRNRRSLSSPDIRHQITPPFSGDMINIDFRIQPCNGYNFDLKIVTPRNAVLGEVKNLRLPKLSQVADFHPPSLTSVFRVDPSGSTISVNPSAGIPATCVQDFLQAVDNYLMHLNNGLAFRKNQESMQFNQTYQWAKKLHDHKIQQLSASGCTCHSTYLSINGTSKSSYLYLMGVYHFEGMFEVRNNP